MIIIGDEILGGSVQEVNMQQAATRLRKSIYVVG